jgi:hypothetical protein
MTHCRGLAWLVMRATYCDRASPADTIARPAGSSVMVNCAHGSQEHLDLQPGHAFLRGQQLRPHRWYDQLCMRHFLS